MSDPDLIWMYSLILPSTYIRYWFDDDGILHQRVIPPDEWEATDEQG